MWNTDNIHVERRDFLSERAHAFAKLQEQILIKMASKNPGGDLFVRETTS